VSDPTLDTAVGCYFSLTIDNVNLGVFTTCSGLGMELGVTQFEQGGGGMTVYQLPGRVKYTNLTVTRPIGADTKRTMTWLNSVVNSPSYSTAQISALDTQLRTIFTWTLHGVVPARWTGPSFDAANAQVVTETLELAYGSIDVS
jgi:phage tail-like protein